MGHAGYTVRTRSHHYLLRMGDPARIRAWKSAPPSPSAGQSSFVSLVPLQIPRIAACAKPVTRAPTTSLSSSTPRQPYSRAKAAWVRNEAPSPPPRRVAVAAGNAYVWRRARYGGHTPAADRLSQRGFWRHGAVQTSSRSSDLWNRCDPGRALYERLLHLSS